MKPEQLWQQRVRDAADRVLAPLAADGGMFRYDELDYAARTVQISYRLDDCEMCSIAPDDLAGILDEGIQRVIGSPVSVRLTELPAPT